MPGVILVHELLPINPKPPTTLHGAKFTAIRTKEFDKFVGNKFERRSEAKAAPKGRRAGEGETGNRSRGWPGPSPE